MKWAILLLALPMAGQDLGAALAAASRDSLKYVGYEVPMQAGHDTICSNWSGGLSSHKAKLKLDGPTRLRILFRVDHGRVDKMLLVSDDCEIDVGKQTLVMLSGISTAASIAYLSGREDDSGLYAISLHNDPKATQQLIAMARDTKNPRRQKKAFFWLARSKDAQAGQFIEKILR